MHRGYAFVKFPTIDEATALLDLHESNPLIISGEMCKMDYSNVNNVQNDWTCRHCQAYNFERREVCFKCNQPKPGMDVFIV